MPKSSTPLEDLRSAPLSRPTETLCARLQSDGSWDFAGHCPSCGAADEHICGRGARGFTARPTALAEAEARGRRQGLEEAGEIIDAERAKWGWLGNQGLNAAQDALDRLRSLATAPAETQKPEEPA